MSNAGHVVGSSMMNQGSGLPFIWSDANGMVAIPLATGTSQGSARGVNSAGLGGGPGFFGLLDSVSLGWDDDLSAGGPAASRFGLGLIDEHFVVGARHQR